MAVYFYTLLNIHQPNQRKILKTHLLSHYSYNLYPNDGENVEKHIYTHID